MTSIFDAAGSENATASVAKFLGGGAISVTAKIPLVGWTCLHIAGMRADIDLCRFLVTEKKHPVDLKDASGRTALMHACLNASSKGCVTLLKFFLEEGGANVNLADSEGNTALHLLCEARHSPSSNEAVLILLDFGANALQENKNAKTPVGIARSRGRAQLVQTLHSRSAPRPSSPAVRASSSSSSSPLRLTEKKHEDLTGPHSQSVIFELEEEAPSPASVATAAVVVVVEQKASSSSSSSATSSDFLEACRRGDFAEVSRMLDEDPNLANCDSSAAGESELQDSPLHVAASISASVECCRALLEKNASVHKLNFAGQTPFEKCASNCTSHEHLACVKLLLQNGTQVDRPHAVNQMTALHRAIASSTLPKDIQAALVDLLLSFGADPDKKTALGKDAFFFATSKGNPRINAILQSRMTSVKSKQNLSKGTSHFLASAASASTSASCGKRRRGSSPTRVVTKAGGGEQQEEEEQDYEELMERLEGSLKEKDRELSILRHELSRLRDNYESNRTELFQNQIAMSRNSSHISNIEELNSDLSSCVSDLKEQVSTLASRRKF